MVDLSRATKTVSEEWSNAAASMVLNQDYKDQIVTVFKFADRMNLVGGSVDWDRKEDIPGGIIVHL